MQKAQHVGHTTSAFRKHRLVPTALAVAGSMNVADHAGTFSALVAFLREKVMFAHKDSHAAPLNVRPAHWTVAHALHSACLFPSNLCDLPSPRCKSLGLYNCSQGCHAALLQHQDLAANRGHKWCTE